MGLLETLLVELGAALLMAIVIGVLLRSMLRGRAGAADSTGSIEAMITEMETLKATRADLETKLAVEQFKASRLPEIEAALAEANSKIVGIRDEKAGIEAELAAAREAATGSEGQVKDLRERLAEAERVLSVAHTNLDVMRGAKADIDGTLATRTEALNGAEAVVADLKERLVATESQRTDLDTRLLKLKDDKAASDEILSARTEALRRAEAVVADLKERLVVAEGLRADLDTRLSKLKDEKGAADETLSARTEALSGSEAVCADLKDRLATTEGQRADLDVRLLKLNDDKAATDEALATRTEALSRAEAVIVDLRERLTVTEGQRADVDARLLKLMDEKAATDETLSARTEALNGAEAVVADLKERLAATESQRTDLNTRLLMLKDDKAAADEALAARTEALSGSQKTGAALLAKLDDITTELTVAQRRAADLQANVATIQESLEQERKQAGEKIALLVEARAEMSKEFKTLAEEVMSRHGESFSKLNKEQIDGILTPLREKLGEFERNVQTSHTESVKERATLAEQIRHIAATGAAMGKETKDLTEALRGKSQSQGAWGEMVLGSILERSGLRVDDEYTVQTTFSSEDGKRLRPDVVINMPNDHRIVVDAKVSLTAFDALVNAGSDEERSTQLAQHLVSVRSHITLLGSKEYHLATGTTLDYVLMFVPIEGALAAALQADPTLITFAAERNVTITTPTTLMIALRTVRNFWQVERRNQNADEIAIRAGKLYDKFVSFMVDFKAVGDSMERTRQTYDLAMGKMSVGRGNVVRQLEQLKSMGARTSKALPTSLLEAAEGNILAIASDVIDTDPDIEASSGILETDPEAGTD